MNLPDNHPLMQPQAPLVLAPMADLTHSGLRTIIHRFGGCGLFFTEMISAASLISGGIYESWYTCGDPQQSYTVAQLLGNKAEILLEGAKFLVRQGFSHIDLNFGCSAPEILQRQQGAALLREKESMYSIVGRLREGLPESVHLSAKIRLGDQEDTDEILKMVQKLESQGLSFLTVHPKLIRDKASRKARWDMMGQLRDALKIPLIGNGGIEDIESFRYREKASRAGGYMIGRAAVQKPWIFREIQDKRNGNPTVLKQVDIKETALEFFHLLRSYQPEDFYVSRARRFSLYFHKNLKFGYKFHFSKIQQAEKLEEIEQHYREYFLKHPDERIKKISR